MSAPETTPGQAARKALSEAIGHAMQSASTCTAQGPCEGCESNHADAMNLADAYAAAQERPAAARADEFARMKVKLSALVASMEETVRPRENCEHDDISREFDDGAVHATAVTLRQLRAILDETALGAQERPAPELAAAMREARLYREAITALVDRLKTSAAATHPSKKSAIEFELIRKLQKILEGK